MKRIDCPYCHKAIYSEHFHSGETLACPNCSVSLKVNQVNDELAICSISANKFASGVFANRAASDPIVLADKDIMVLGEVMAEAMDITSWPSLSTEQLQQLKLQTRELISAIGSEDKISDVLKFRLSLLDIFSANLSLEDFDEN